MMRSRDSQAFVTYLVACISAVILAAGGDALYLHGVVDVQLKHEEYGNIAQFFAFLALMAWAAGMVVSETVFLVKRRRR